MNIETIPITEYLHKKGIPFKERYNELIVKCLFSGCDENSREDEGHLYFSTQTNQYHCKKCNASGNIFTLAEHFGDKVKDIAKNTNTLITPTKQSNLKNIKFDDEYVDKHHEALPKRIREYLNERGIPDNIIDKHKLGYGQFYGKNWITIPIKNNDDKYIFFKLRRDPDDKDNEVKYKFYPKGSSATVYGFEMLKNNDDSILICEGEFDQLILESKGIPAITSTAGAGTFKKEWFEYLKNLKKVYVCFDNDDTGEKESESLVRNLLKLEDINIFKITLPEEVGSGGDDITDYFINLNGNIDDLFSKFAKEVLSLDDVKRVLKVDKPKNTVTFDEWRKVIEDNFPELIFPAEVSLSIISQILIKDITNPFALVLVDVPSSGKTITINFFSEIEGLTYATDKFSPASFVSNAANVKKEKLKEIDLLPRLRYKMFLIRDLATLFSKREDDLNECLGILTRVLDGEGLNTDTGVHGQRQYVGEYLFMLLAGSTPIQPRIWKTMGNLGSRLFFLNLNRKDKSEDELADQIVNLSHKKREKTCQKATKDFLYNLWFNNSNGIEWDKENDPREYRLIIGKCAKLLSKLRGVINLWQDRSEDGTSYTYTSPVIEQPDRINQLFYNLCRGHAVACGRRQINEVDLKLIVELAVDSAPTIRARFFRQLLECNGQMRTNQVESSLQCSKPTALKEMEILKILGVCNVEKSDDQIVGEPEKIIKLSYDFKWFLSDECKKIRKL